MNKNSQYIYWVKGWKVLSIHRTSCRASKWGAESEHWNLNYPVYVEVAPKVEGSKIFFFKHKHDAEYFLSPMYKEIIVPCLAKGVSTPISIGDDIEHMFEFWEEYNYVHGIKHDPHKLPKNIPIAKLLPAPEGTLLAESIICLE